MKSNNCHPDTNCEWCHWNAKDPFFDKYRYSDDRKPHGPDCYHRWCEANRTDERSCIALLCEDLLIHRNDDPYRKEANHP